ncbi:MAG: hypothetical protein PVF58_11350 [Candidatus Methanofastidiosia archaeon]|jgi:hypothetical protein
MQKKSVFEVMTLCIVVILCCNPVGTHLNYDDQICPLANHNIEVAENLMEIVRDTLEEARGQGLNISEEEIIVTEAEKLLQKVKKFNLQSNNCITGNMYTIKSIKLLEKSLELLNAKMNTLRDEEYAVYRALIEQVTELFLVRYEYDELQFIVIIDHTSGCEPDEDLNKVLEWVGQEMPLAEQETLDSFQLRNKESHPLGDYFNLSVEVVLVSIEEVREIFLKGNEWEEYDAKYPFSQGTMTLSRVGFNAEMNQALLFVENMSYESVGAGCYILFTKENDDWIIQDWVISWIS